MNLPSSVFYNEQCYYSPQMRYGFRAYKSSKIAEKNSRELQKPSKPVPEDPTNSKIVDFL